MIPLGDENPTRTRPYIVYALVIINILVYLVDHVLFYKTFEGIRLNALWDYSMVPFSVVNNIPTMIKYPVMLNTGMHALVPVPHQGLNPQWLTIFSSMFLHGSFMHLGGNMLYLWIFGNNIEDTLGHFKFLIFYLVTGAIAALAHVYFALRTADAMVPTVGASGAIAGVLGAYLLLYPQARIRTMIWLGFFIDFVDIPAIFVLGVWFLLQLTGTFGTGGQVGGGVAYWAHVGGFVAGLIIIFLMGGKKLIRGRGSYNTRQYGRDDWR